MTLLCRVVINPDRIEVNVSRHRIAALLAGQSIDIARLDPSLVRYSDDVVILTTPARLKRVSRK